ncbi:sn-glycerol-3-phosphate ABC transporter ATP-binding protein UgpC [Frigidibacter sp. SD6-1]|uniref:ABC transporter ATP-binding protein n=1 Tax=Frigidibacter sp. SD6-1 TaxID=3032581 RepID=UPI0024DFF7C2|nr:sn-glycerol-3-phosphate ABC transporter ATP-binding protein UgpC [Frigidibacter sp. SD6-1]
MASLTIDSVGKKYGEVRAIKNVSLTVEDGEFLVLVGPSGCGKSTLLRMIAGLESLTEGRIFLGDRDVSAVDPKDRDVAMVFQNYALYPHMTVFENMAFGLRQRKVPKAEAREKVLQAARILDLESLIDRKPGALSGGQRQRVAMGRAIVRSPAIYLMDEPLSNLDAKLRVQMRAELKLLRQRLGVTTVYVTHDQVEAMTLGDRVAVLSPHRADEATNLQQCDSPQQLYLEPRNMFVAGFIGSPAMNFVYADITAAGQALSARIVGTDTDLALTPENLPVFAALRAHAGRRVIMGIRPEYVSLAPHGAAMMSQEMSVDVTISELVGPDAFLHFDLPTPEVGRELLTVLNDGEKTLGSGARFVARVAAERLAAPSGRMTLHLDIRRLHFFDEATTLRIA